MLLEHKIAMQQRFLGMREGFATVRTIAQVEPRQSPVRA